MRCSIAIMIVTYIYVLLLAHLLHLLGVADVSVSYINKCLQKTLYVFARCGVLFVICHRCIKVSFSEIAAMDEVNISGQMDSVS